MTLSFQPQAPNFTSRLVNHLLAIKPLAQFAKSQARAMPSVLAIARSWQKFKPRPDQGLPQRSLYPKNLGRWLAHRLHSCRQFFD